jgi:phage major head subunit gpT-like protein
MLRGNYSDLYGSAMLPAMEELFRYELQQAPSLREALFKIVATERDIWQSSELHDMPLFREVQEGQDYSFDAPAQGANKTLSPKKYGLGFSISEEAVDDGKFAMISDAIAKMAKSGRESQQIQAMDIFNNGFSGTTTADGVALFSASHTLPSGGTVRNKLSADSDLSDSSLKQALIDFKTQFVGDSGIIYPMQPRTLLVPSALEFIAKELVGSDLSTATANDATGITNTNNMNSLKSQSLQVVVSPHLTDSDAWFLLAAPAETGLRIVSRKPIETKAAGMDAGFNNDSILYKSRYREVIGAVHHLGAFGTPGA